MARVLIVDDSDSMRLLVRLSLELDESFEVVGEAANGLDGLRKSEELDPDLIVMDLSMPVMDGIEATRRIKQGRPEVGIVAFTSAGEEAIVQKVLAAGAYARVDKEDLIGLIHALQELDRERVPVVVAESHGSVHDVWARSRAGIAAALSSLAASARSIRGVHVAGAFGGGVALLAALMFLVTTSPGGHDPSGVIRPEEVLGPETVAPEIGSIELKGDVHVTGSKDRDRHERGGESVEPVVVSVASLDEPASSVRPESRPHKEKQPRRHEGHQANGGKGAPTVDGSAGKDPQIVTPPVAAKKHGKGPGLAKKPGGLPPGRAKKTGLAASTHKTPPGHAKKSHPNKGGKH